MTNEYQDIIWLTCFKCMLDHEESVERQQAFLTFLDQVFHNLDATIVELMVNKIKQKTKSDNNMREMYQTDHGPWKTRDMWIEFFYKHKEI